MPVHSQNIQLSTRGNADVCDITETVTTAILKTDFTNGIVTIFCPSATSGITTIEFESGCITDLRRLFDEIVDPNKDFAHNERWGDYNGHSHVRAALLGPSLTVPFISQRLTLGTWQQIIFIDFDNRPRQRELVLQIIGE